MNGWIVAAIGLLLLGGGAAVAAPVSSPVGRIADAIAFAEGFFLAGSRPKRNHNPGNLTVDIYGGAAAVGADGPFVRYASDADGWADLRQQVAMMLDGSSAYYSPEMTIWDVARRWTTTDQQAWASNVAGRLGVSTSTRLYEL